MTITRTELKPIVENAGGVEAFAAMLETKPRTVQSWLRGDRRMTATAEKLMRILLAIK